MKRIVIFFLVATVFLISCEKEKIEVNETGSISGTVVDSESEQPIEGVVVTTNPPSSSVLTDNMGSFVINSVKAGDVAVSARKDQYENSMVSINVSVDENTAFVIAMDKSDDYGRMIKIQDPFPPHQSVDMEVEFNFSWSYEMEQESDSVKFDVVLFESNVVEATVIGHDISDTSLTSSKLLFNDTYYWQVIAKVEGEEIGRSETWSFLTKELPDYPFVYTRKVDNSYEIIYSDTSITNAIQLTNDPSGIDWFPRISPDRSKIAFTSNRTTDPQIYVMNRDGSELVKISSLKANTGYYNVGEGFCWSPDGHYFLYSNYRKLFKIDNSGYGLTEIAMAPENRNFKAVDWNGVTNKVVVQTIGENIYDSEIYIMNADGSEMELLIEDKPGRLEYPSFAVHGGKVLYTWDASGLDAADGRQLDARIYLYDLLADTAIDLSGGKLEGTNDLQPRFSPNGAQVIFINTSNTGTGVKDIWCMNSDGSNRELLVADAMMPDCF